MDWLHGMNSAVKYIEERLTETISYEAAARTVGCSVYEFSRIFSFMTGVSLSEYVRRRRLSNAVFDIQKGEDKIIDVALKYCYESPSTFARAFKELHGVTPLAARKPGTSLVMFPPISFALTIKGVSEMRFRIEKREAFELVGDVVFTEIEDKNVYEPAFYNRHILPENPEKVSLIASLVGDLMLVDKDRGIYEAENGMLFTIEYKGSQRYFMRFDGNLLDCYYYTAAIDYHLHDGKVKKIIGIDESDFDEKAKLVSTQPGHLVPAADWAVFTVTSETEKDAMSCAYMRILTEWFPESIYRRDETKPHMEKHKATKRGTNEWEIWMPIIPKGSNV